MEDARENLNSNLSPSTNEFERLKTLTPLFPESSVQYSVSMGEINSVVMASSTFEAAIKFTFWLNETRLIQANATNVEISYGGDRYIYTVSLDGGKPDVELCYMVRKSLVGEDDVTDQLIVNGVNKNISTGVHIDLETSELIDITLKQFFCFSSFLPLQKETIVSTMQGKNVMTIVGTGGGNR